MFLAIVFYSKIVYYEGEADWLGDVAPETVCMCNFVVAMLGKTFFEEPVSKFSGLGKAVHSLSDFPVDITIFDFFMEVVL